VSRNVDPCGVSDEAIDLSRPPAPQIRPQLVSMSLGYGVLGAERHDIAAARPARRGRAATASTCARGYRPGEGPSTTGWRHTVLPAPPAAGPRVGGPPDARVRKGAISRRARRACVRQKSTRPSCMPGGVSAWTQRFDGRPRRNAPGSDSGQERREPRVENVTRAAAVCARGPGPTPGWPPRPRRGARRQARVRDRSRLPCSSGVPGVPSAPARLVERDRASRRRTTSDPGRSPSHASSSPVPTPKRMVGDRRDRRCAAKTARVAGSAKRAYFVRREASRPSCRRAGRPGARPRSAPRSGSDGHGGQPVGQLLPELGIPVHQGLDLGKGAGRPALHGVAWPR